MKPEDNLGKIAKDVVFVIVLLAVILGAICLCAYYIRELSTKVDGLENDLKSMRIRMYLNNRHDCYYNMLINKIQNIEQKIESLEDDIDGSKLDDESCCCEEGKRPICESTLDYM